MLEVHYRTITAIDVFQARCLPQVSCVRVFLNDEEGKLTELWSSDGRSFPTLSAGEAEGAAYFGGHEKAFTQEEAEAAAMEWIRANLLGLMPRSDHKLVYSRPKPDLTEIACTAESVSEIEVA
jgi:hypothetical protein